MKQPKSTLNYNVPMFLSENMNEGSFAPYLARAHTHKVTVY